MSEVRLEKFVRRITIAGSGYTKLCLVQVMLNGGESLLQEHALTSQYGYDETAVKDIVAEFMATAQGDADGSTGVNTYCIKAMRGIAKGERSPVFRLRSENEDSVESSMLGLSEPPNMVGLLGTLMRHLEADRRTSAIKDEIHAKSSMHTIATLTEQVKHYQDKHWEFLQHMEELANEKEGREIARLQATSREKRLDSALQTFKPLVPIAIAKLKGVPTDQKAGLQVIAIKEVLKNLDPKKVESIMEILGPNALPLIELFLDANKDDVEAEETKAKAEAEAAASAAKH